MLTGVIKHVWHWQTNWANKPRHLMIEFGLVEFGRTKTSILAKTHLLILHILQSTQAII